MNQQRRYVTVDFNVLYANRLTELVERDDQVVLCHAIVGDIAGNKRFDEHIQKFPEWFRNKADQIWLAHEWVTLVDREQSYRDRTVGLAWIDRQWTQILRRSSAGSIGEWQRRFRRIRSTPELARFEQSREAFVEMCEGTGRLIRERLPRIHQRLNRGPFVEEATNIVRDPALGALWPRRMGRAEPKYLTKPWIKALSRFPDVKAYGRISRIMCWYSFVHAAGRTADFDNNYEDAMYAFTASYTGWLATLDNPLRAMVAACFPQVRLLPAE